MSGQTLRKSARAFAFGGFALLASIAFSGQGQQLSAAGQKIEDVMMHLRTMSDSDRAIATKKAALDIRKMAPSNEKVLLANGLANLATEGDFGKGTLQEVATTLDLAVQETPQQPFHGEPNFAYSALAQLARYEHLKVTDHSAGFKEAMARFVKADQARQAADFSLLDITGHTWTLSNLKGKIVLVNFWATWCPPCRKEMPDMETLYQKYKDKGLVILAISDEDKSKVEPFIAKNKYTYPILLDPGRKVNTMFTVDGIPKSFIFDRNGKLAAQAIDMRTMDQFKVLLSRVGLK